MKHKGSFTPHPHQDGLLYVVHHSFHPCSMPSVNKKSKNCEERSSFLSKKIKWQHRKGSNQSFPNPESAALATPGEAYTCITKQPAWISQKERDCCQLSQARWPFASVWHDWGPWKFFQLMCAILAVTNSWEVHMNICIYFRDVIDWTTFIIQWNLSFGTPLISRHKICSKKNVHIIFVSITSIEGTPLFKEKGQFFWALKTRFAFNKVTP